MKCISCKTDDNFHGVWDEKLLQFRRICNVCGKQTGTYPKEKSTNRPSAHSSLVKKIGINYCEDCMRTVDELPPPQVLEAHHIIEYSEGGTDDRSNIKILCTPCHKEVHHKRTYYAHYKKLIK